MITNEGNSQQRQSAGAQPQQKQGQGPEQAQMHAPSHGDSHSDLHSHGHSHSQSHSHSHAPTLQKINTAFMIGIGLNTAFLVIEFIVGYAQNSLALISDAGHNATDVFSLLVSLFAFKMMQAKATKQYTYGYKKGTILASLLNAVLLLVTVFFIFMKLLPGLANPYLFMAMSYRWWHLSGFLSMDFLPIYFSRIKSRTLISKGPTCIWSAMRWCLWVWSLAGF